MASIFDAAHYILDTQGPMSSMKLQKLCFYAQFWSYGWMHKPLFEDEFRAWASGPVNEELYRYIKEQLYDGAMATKELLKSKCTISLSAEEKSVVDKVLHYYGNKSPEELHQSSIAEYPWISSYGGYGTHNIITKEKFQEAHQALRN